MNILQRLVSRILTPQVVKDWSDKWKAGLLISPEIRDSGVVYNYSESSVVHIGISKIASCLPQAPLRFYRGSNEIQQNDPLYTLFKKPNSYNTYFTFFEKTTISMGLYGEAFWYLEGSLGQAAGTSTLPGAIWLMPPDKMKEDVDEKGILRGWSYDNKKPFRTDQVIHVFFPNPYSTYRGLSPLKSVKMEIDSDYLAGVYTRSFFINGASPGTAFLSHIDDESTAEQRKEFLRQWNTLHQGASKGHKASILNPGMDVKKVGSTQEEMDFNELRKELAVRILAALDVPPPVVGILDEATYSNVETTKRLFWEDCIKSYMRKYEDTINAFFLDRFAPGTYCKFDLSEIEELKRGHKEVAETVEIYANHGVPLNTLVDAFNLPFDPQEGLDTGFIAMNLIPVDEAYDNPLLEQMNSGKMINVTPKLKMLPKLKEIDKKLAEKEVDKGIQHQIVKTRKTLESKYQKALKNYLWKQRNKVLEKLDSTKTTKDGLTMEVLTSELDQIWNQESDRLVVKMKPIYEDIASTSGTLARGLLDVKEPYVIDALMIEKRLNFISKINKYTYDLIKTQLKDGIEKGETIADLTQRVKDTYERMYTLEPGMTITRATKITRTETGSLMNEVSYKEYRENGVEKKKWIGGSRPSHSAINGEVVNIDETFSNGLSFPGDPSGPPEEVINCECSIAPIVE